MIRENATVVNIQFVRVIIKLTLPIPIIYGLKRQKIRAFNKLSLRNVGSFMRVSTVVATSHTSILHRFPLLVTDNCCKG